MAGYWSGPNYFGDDTNDVASGSAVVNYLYGNAGSDVLKGFGGNDQLVGGVGDDTLEGGVGDDVLYDLGSGIPSGFTGPIGRDVLRGGGGNDRLVFQSPDTGDFLYGDLGTDTAEIRFLATMSTADPIVFTLLQGGSTARIGDANTVFVQGVERIIFEANIGADIVTGGALSDEIYGMSGNDVLRGLGGDDTLDGGTGVQDIDGGGAIDTVSFDLRGAEAGLTLSMGAAIALGAFGSVKNVERWGTIFTGSGNDRITVGDGGGTFSTGFGADTVTGGAGADTFHLGAGSDVAHLGAGNDVAIVYDFDDPYGGNNFDTAAKVLYGEDGDDGLRSAAGSDLLDGGRGDDHLFGGRGTDTLKGGEGQDDLDGGGGADTLSGGAGNDILASELDDAPFQTVLSIDNDVLKGEDGNDSLHGGAGLDRLSGGAGDDFLSLRPNLENGVALDMRVDQVDGGNGTDTLAVGLDYRSPSSLHIAIAAKTLVKVDGALVASVTSVEQLNVNATAGGNHVLTGGQFKDNLWTYGGNDRISALGGDDYVNTGIGSDWVDAGAGNDEVQLELGGTDTVKSGVGDDFLVLRARNGDAPVGLSTYDMGQGYDILTLEASGRNVTFDGTNIRYDGAIVGKVTAYEALRFYGSAQSSPFTGTAKDDQVYFLEGSSADIINGMAGDDLLAGGGGNDTLNGGVGSDAADYTTSYSASVSVTLAGADFANVTVGTTEVDRIRNIENVYGGLISDTLIGDAHANLFRGGGGNDTMDGRGGSDTADYSTSYFVPVSVTLAGSAWVSVTAGTSEVDQLRNIENVHGSSGSDRLTGDRFANLFKGGSGDDTLDGGGGEDTLFGGAGADVLDGGAGADAFLFGNGFVDAVAAGVDTVEGFERGADVLDFRGFVLSDPIQTREVKLEFIGKEKFSGALDEIRFVNGLLSLNLDEDARADIVIRIEGIDKLSQSDFLFDA